MTVEISWQQPKRVVYARLYDVVTIEELISTQDDFLRFIDEGDAPVHSLIDLRAVREFPRSLSQVRQALERDTHTSSGRIMIVLGSNPLVKFIAHMISQVLFKGSQFTFCNSLDEAVGYLRQCDPTATLEDFSLQS